MSMVFAALALTALSAAGLPRNVEGSPAARAVLCAPLPVTWAANHPEVWTRHAVQGMIASGIATGMDAPLGRADLSEDDAFAQAMLEVRAANARLEEAGVSSNFLHFPIAPGLAWFTERDLGARAIAAMTAAGRFCRETKLDGIALDTRDAAFIFDPDWEGYDTSAIPMDLLAARARDLARKMARAFIRECSETELLLLSGPIAKAEYLWFAFAQGIAEAPGAADTVTVQIAALDAALLPSLATMPEALSRVSTLLESEMDPETLAVWMRTGGLAVSVSLPDDAIEPGVFRQRLAAAKAFSTRYAIVNAPSGGWWTIAPEEIAQFSQSCQPTLLRPAPPLEGAESCTFACALDRFKRIGPCSENPFADALVLDAERGAALYAPAGLATSIEDTGVKPLLVTRLDSGEQRLVRQEKAVRTVEPSKDALLIEGLDPEKWLLPAAARATLSPPPQENMRRTLARFSFRNPLPWLLEGTLRFDVPPEYSLGAAEIPISLAPGQPWEDTRAFQGRFNVGDRVPVIARCVQGKQSLFERRFFFDIAPEMIASFKCNGIPRVCGAGEGRFCAATETGEIVYCDGSGKPLWSQLFPDPFDAAPVLVRDAEGKRLVIAGDRKGAVRALDAAGGLVWLTRLDTPCQQLVPVNEKDIACALASNTITLLDASGGFQWAYMLPDGWDLVELRANGEDVAVLASGPDNTGALSLLDAKGFPAWREDIPATPVRMAATVGKRPPWNLAVGCDDGSVFLFAAHGGERARVRLGETPVVALTALAKDGWAAADKTLLTELDGEGQIVWQTPLESIIVLGAGLYGAKCHVIAATLLGEQYGLDARGGILWRDTRAQSPISGDILVTPGEQGGQIALFGLTERRLQFLKLD